MPAPEQFLAFLVAAMLITLAPGPDNMMVLSMGIARGKRTGIAFGLGCAVGCLSHTMLAVLGISALIAASATAFTVLKICGGLYLVWLGINALRSRGTMQIGQSTEAIPGLGKLFLKGVFANAINPKVILFFLSFLPQFVVADSGSITTQIALLGLIFTTQAAVIFSLIGCFSGALGQWINTSPKIGLWLDRLAGAIFVGLGLRLIVSR